jgi:hypothetical protein
VIFGHSEVGDEKRKNAVMLPSLAKDFTAAYIFARIYLILRVYAG